MGLNYRKSSSRFAKDFDLNHLIAYLRDNLLTTGNRVLNWIPALGIALVIVIAVLVLSKWLEKKNYSQQLELLNRKKERLQAKPDQNQDDTEENEASKEADEGKS